MRVLWCVELLVLKFYIVDNLKFKFICCPSPLVKIYFMHCRQRASCISALRGLLRISIMTGSKKSKQRKTVLINISLKQFQSKRNHTFIRNTLENYSWTVNQSPFNFVANCSHAPLSSTQHLSNDNYWHNPCIAPSGVLKLSLHKCTVLLPNTTYLLKVPTIICPLPFPLPLKVLQDKKIKGWRSVQLK